MKKMLALLFAVASVCFVSCDKEKEKKPTNKPTEFNQYAAIRLPIAETQTKGGKYDVQTIYENATQIHYNQLSYCDMMGC